MNLLRHQLVLAVTLSAGALAVATPARADGCRDIRAEINLGAGTIRGNFGLRGTLTFTADSNSPPPATAPAGTSVFSGILEIVTEDGTLEIRETGMFSSRTGNPAGPLLSSFGETLSGTGRYEGVTGDLFFTGQRDEDGAFVVEMSGSLCRP
jgi:hypothetical protein